MNVPDSLGTVINMNQEEPHIYKKGKVINLKKLDQSTIESRYTFRSSKPNIQNIVYSTNNINQVVARNWLKLSKIMHYFGISRDISDKVSKTQRPYNKLAKDISFLIRGSGQENNNETLKRINHLDQKIDNLKTEPLLTEERIKNLEEKLEEIRVAIKSMVG